MFLCLFKKFYVSFTCNIIEANRNKSTVALRMCDTTCLPVIKLSLRSEPKRSFALLKGNVQLT